MVYNSSIMMFAPTVLFLAFVVDGFMPADRKNRLPKAASLRHGSLQGNGAIVTNVGRQLLPHPPHHHDQHSNQYQSCLGLSKEERAEAWIFQGEMEPCEIVVDGVVVAGDDGSGGGNVSSGSNGSGSNGESGTETSGGGSSSSEYESANSGSSSSGSSSGGGTGSSSGGGYSGGNSNGEGNDGYSNGSSSGNDGDGSTSNTSLNGYDSGSGGSGERSSSYVSGGTEGDEGGSISAPLRYFNFTDCGTYSSIWIWDLALTCESSTSFESCECTSAEVLYQYGELECEPCPENCPVCNTCLKLLGCSSEDIQGEHRLPTKLEQELMSGALPIALGVSAAVASLVVGATLYQYKKRSIVLGEGPANSLI